MIICKIRRARLSHRCWRCIEPIDPGSRYARHSLPPDDIAPFWRNVNEHLHHRHPEELNPL